MSTEMDVSKFGIQPEDEFPHAFSEDHADWNESYFFDWYDATGSNAGHCRIGWHPVQKRVLFWLYLFNGSEWFVIEENRLPFSELQLGKVEDSNSTVVDEANCHKKAFAYQGWGLEFSYQPKQLLRTGELHVKGFARVLSGARQGMIKAVELTLNVTAQGPAYSRGGGSVDGHTAQGFSTDRYEQPTQSHCQMIIDGECRELKVRGERDHSWGPRPWDMGWQFFVVNNEHFSLCATQVMIPEWPLINMGYYHAHGGEMENLNENTEFNLQFNADDPTQAVSGSFSLNCDSGRKIQGVIEVISGTEIDITHTFASPHRTEYRRSLIRCRFDDGSESIGWLECNRESD
ncbi:MAG: hypothetical protein HRU20_09245 [Pseudomonadales bacterium]|nr:hypothetical protein [Pseudomonadales bacterium]